MGDQELTGLEELIDPINNDNEEEPSASKQENQFSQENHIDPFTAFMFGTRRAEQLSGQIPGAPLLQNPYPNQRNIDIEVMFGHIDTLIESVRGLKPLFQKVYPYIENYIKKK